MIDDTKPNRKSDTPDKLNTQRTDVQKSGGVIKTQDNKPFATTRQDGTSIFDSPLSSHTIKVYDVNDSTSFCNWFNSYIINNKSIKDTKNSLYFNKTSTFFSLLILGLTSIFVINFSFLLLAKTLLLFSYWPVFIGIAFMAFVAISIAVFRHLLIINKYGINKEYLKLIDEKSMAGGLIELFQEIFNDENLNLTEDINYKMLAKKIKEVAERTETLKKTSELNSIITKMIIDNEKKLDEGLTNENLQQITNLTTTLLTCLFSSIEDNIEDENTISFINQAKIIFLNKCLESNNFKNIYKIFNKIFITDKVLIPSENMQENTNNIQDKILNAINEGVRNYVSQENLDI